MMVFSFFTIFELIVIISAHDRSLVEAFKNILTREENSFKSRLRYAILNIFQRKKESESRTPEENYLKLKQFFKYLSEEYDNFQFEFHWNPKFMVFLKKLAFKMCCYNLDGNSFSTNDQSTNIKDELSFFGSLIHSDIHTYDSIGRTLTQKLLFLCRSKYFRSLFQAGLEIDGNNIAKMIKSLLDLNLKDEKTKNDQLIMDKLKEIAFNLKNDQTIRGNFILNNIENDSFLKCLSKLFQINLMDSSYPCFKSIKTGDKPSHFVAFSTYDFTYKNYCFKLDNFSANKIKRSPLLIFLKKWSGIPPFVHDYFYLLLGDRLYMSIAAYSDDDCIYLIDVDRESDTAKWIKVQEGGLKKVDPENREETVFDLLLFELVD